MRSELTAEEWIRLYEPGLLAFARVLVGYHQAQDVAQEALIRALPQLRRITDPEAWLRKATMNYVIDRQRKTAH